MLVAVAWTPASTLVNVAAPSAVEFFQALVFNVLHFSVWALTTPLLLKLCDRLPLHGRTILRNGGLLLIAGVVAIPAITLVLPLAEEGVAILQGGDGLVALDLAQIAQRVFVTSLFALPTYFAVIAIGQTLVWARRAEVHAREAAGAEIRALRAELNPHFLFNTLGAIAQLAHRAPAKAETAIETLAQVLRASLADTGRTQTIADAVGEIEEHLSLYSMLHGEIRFDRRIADDLWGYDLPSRVMLPLVENAMTHGALDSDGARWLRLVVDRSGLGQVTLELSNPAPATAAPSRGLGSGIEASRRLLAIHLGEQASLHHYRTENAYHVQLVLPE